MPRFRIGIDVGGTFTDFVVYDTESGAIRTSKEPTTPADPSRGILTGLAKLQLAPSDVESIAHGTTTATNALIERDGARVAFLTTEGFRDTLEIRRANRQQLFDAQWVPPPALVPRRNRLEIRERLRWDGQEVVPVDDGLLDQVIETIRARGIESVAICFLHSYQYPAHEEYVRDRLASSLPDVFVTTSSECSQEFREFERSSTVAANAFVGPKVRHYMARLKEGIEAAGLNGDIAIMQSNGGICSIEEAGHLPVKLARSGPAGGAMALAKLAELTGNPSLVGVDIGGTSADVSIIVDGQPRWTSPLIVEWGLPLLFPSVDVISIGAGGGSIAWIDSGGALRMGPHSAGADPGPACYGLGGEQPTSTDAHVLLGRVSSSRFGDGTLTLDGDRSREAISRFVAEPLGLDAEAAAEGMLRILDSAMLQAIRFVTIEKGYDPRGFTLVGLGGGGPLHVVELARELGMSTALVPNHPGVLSAWGMLTVDMVQDRSRTVLRRRSMVEIADLNRTVGDLRGSIEQAFVRQGVDVGVVMYEYFLDLQYYGQAYSLSIGLNGFASPPQEKQDEFRMSEEGVLTIRLAERVTDEALDAAVLRFHDEHAREYGHADREREVQVVHVRVFGRVAVPSLDAAPGADAGPDPSPARTGSRPVRLAGETVEADVYARDLLRPGNLVEGPALVDETSSTTVLPTGSSAVVDPWGNLAIATGVA